MPIPDTVSHIKSKNILLPEDGSFGRLASRVLRREAERHIQGRCMVDEGYIFPLD